jgi:hypothetical protein
MSQSSVIPIPESAIKTALEQAFWRLFADLAPPLL